MTLLKKYWYIGVIALLIGALVLFFVLKKKKTVIEPPKPVEITDDSGNKYNFQPGIYTDALFDEVDRDSRWTGRSLQPYKDLLALSNAEFKAVSNDWNQRYFQKAGSKNLFQRLADEKGSYLATKLPFVNWVTDADHDAFPDLRDTIINRAKSLGIY